MSSESKPEVKNPEPVKNSVEVRDELEDRLERDLLGPWDGPDEELPPGVLPAEWYLLGRLVPFEGSSGPAAMREGEPAAIGDPSITDVGDVSTGELDGDDTPSEATVRSGSRAASSMGMSFSVPKEIDTIVVSATWGRYSKVESQIYETEQGRPQAQV